MSDLFIESLKQLDIELSAETITRQLYFMEELLRWNRQINLTAIRDRQEALDKHLLDSLILLKFVPFAGRLLDMGSGGGLPGIPLAIACSELQVTSVDSVGKKISFQKHIRRALSLKNLSPIHSRLEELDSVPGLQEPFDFVVARALASFEDLVRFSAPRLAEGGRLLVMKGSEGEDELKEYKASCDKELFRIASVQHYQLPISRSARKFIVLERTALPIGE